MCRGPRKPRERARRTIWTPHTTRATRGWGPDDRPKRPACSGEAAAAGWPSAHALRSRACTDSRTATSVATVTRATAQRARAVRARRERPNAAQQAPLARPVTAVAIRDAHAHVKRAASPRSGVRFTHAKSSQGTGRGFLHSLSEAALRMVPLTGSVGPRQRRGATSAPPGAWPRAPHSVARSTRACSAACW